jgi:hypothetical protein
VLFHELFSGAKSTPSKFYYIPIDISTQFVDAGIAPDINREEFSKMDSDSTRSPFTAKHNALWDALVISRCHHILEEMLSKQRNAKA